MDPSRQARRPIDIAETRDKLRRMRPRLRALSKGFSDNDQRRFNVPAGQSARWLVENKFGLVGHPRRRDRADRAGCTKASTSASSCSRPPFGPIAEDQAVLRALSAARDAAFQPRQRAAHRLLHGAATTDEFGAKRRRCREGDVRQARSRAGRRPYGAPTPRVRVAPSRGRERGQGPRERRMLRDDAAVAGSDRAGETTAIGRLRPELTVHFD